MKSPMDTVLTKLDCECCPHCFFPIHLEVKKPPKPLILGKKINYNKN